MRRNFAPILLALSAVILKPTQAQNPTTPPTVIGIDPLGSYTSGLDQISVSDLGLHIDIPLYEHASQRGGGSGVAVHLVYDSSYFDTYLGNSNFQVLPNVGWSIQAGASSNGQITRSNEYVIDCRGDGVNGSGGACNDQNILYAFVDSTGFTHQFPLIAATQNHPTNISEYAMDGSGYFLNLNGTGLVSVTTPSGTVYQNSGSPKIDTNGNVDNIATADPNGYGGIVNGPLSFTDTSGVTVKISGGGYTPIVPALPTARSPLYITYTDPNGATQTITITYKIFSIVPEAYQRSTTSPYYIPGPWVTGLVDTITYPDGSAYHFTYQTTSFLPNTLDGELASMQLPTGATITYQNTWSPTPCTAFYGAGTTKGLLSQVIRVTPDGPTTYKNTANMGGSGADDCPVPLVSHTQITHPDATSETVYFVGTPESLTDLDGNFTPTYHNIETSHFWYNASNALLRSTMNCYNTGSGNCTTTVFSLPITKITTTTTLDTGVTSQAVQTKNAYGLPVETDEYDFGATAPTRKTITQYAALGNNIVNQPSSVVIEDGSGNIVGQTTYGYDEYPLASASGAALNTITGSRGNQTSVHKWLNTTGVTIDTHLKYDAAGQVVQSQDGNGNWTAFGYDAATDSCLSSVTPTTPLSGVPMTTHATCDSNTGVVTSQTDLNGVKTSFSYDGMIRPTGATVKNSANTLVAASTTIYSGSTLPETVTTTVTATPSPNQISSVTLDGLGRVTKQIAPSGSETDTVYNSMGQVLSVSNPYVTKSDPTYGLTSYLYDGLGRETRLTHSFDGSYQSWTYAGNQTSFTDETGRLWKRTSDAFGRLTKVLEPDGSSNIGIAPTLETDYQYDQLNNLLRVDQWGGPSGSSGDRVRLFQYDSLSRLLNACNPETIPGGATCTASGPWGASYTYDANGNVLTKQDARNILINYINYDSLNRLGGKTYTIPKMAPNDYASTTAVSYSYDQTTFNGLTIMNGIGRRTGMVDGTGQSAWSYDSMGRIASIVRITNAIPAKTATYTYDLAGNPTNILYYSGSNVSYIYDAAGRATSAVDPNIPVNFVENVTYAPQGALAGMVYGSTSGFSGITTANHYDGRLRLQLTSAGTTAATLESLSYGYYANANIQKITNNVDTTRSQSFLYDNMNRLSSGQAGTLWGNTYVYDPFGNLYQFNQISGTGTGQSITVMPTSNNQLSGGNLAFDVAGNMYQDNQGNTLKYDAEDRVGTAGTYSYGYDGDGNRVIKLGATSRTYWYGANGEVLNEFDSSGNNPERNIFLGGALRARLDSNGNVNYFLGDHIGSARMVVNATGAIEDKTDYYPFGMAASYSTSTSTNLYRFTGKERDTESGNDYFGARYYGSSMGRFMSPDPSGLEYADPTNPQSLNLYSYVLNNPLHYVDPTGMYCDYSDHNDPQSGFDPSQFDYNSNSGECSQNGGQWVDDAYTHNGADDANRPQYAVSSNTDSGNDPWTFTDFQAMYQAWNTGVLPQQLNYGPWSWESIDMSHNFAVNRARAAYIKAGCPASGQAANSFAAGHYEAAIDSWGNVVLGQPDYLELQVGGFTGTITGGSDNATFTVNNPMSESSFNGQSAATNGHSSDNPNGPNGPRHNVMQTFKWTEQNLCHQ